MINNGNKTVISLKGDIMIEENKDIL